MICQNIGRCVWQAPKSCGYSNRRQQTWNRSIWLCIMSFSRKRNSFVTAHTIDYDTLPILRYSISCCIKQRVREIIASFTRVVCFQSGFQHIKYAPTIDGQNTSDIFKNKTPRLNFMNYSNVVPQKSSARVVNTLALSEHGKRLTRWPSVDEINLLSGKPCILKNFFCTIRELGQPYTGTEESS